jgi:hypothetical protein
VSIDVEDIRPGGLLDAAWREFELDWPDDLAPLSEDQEELVTRVACGLRRAYWRGWRAGQAGVEA